MIVQFEFEPFIMSNTKTIENQVDRLAKKFDTSAAQWQVDGVVIPLEKLSRDDLLQALCECIEVIERMDSIQASMSHLVGKWRDGSVQPQEVDTYKRSMARP